MSVAYKVVAPLAVVQDENGVWHHHYQGAVLGNLGPEQVDHLLGLGFIAKDGSDDAVIVPGQEFLDPAQVAALEDDQAAEVDDAKPPRNAAKPALVEWVVANVAKDDGSDYTEDEASALNKAELWEIIDSIED